MSAEQKFRMFFGSRPATQEELAHVEEITVEQEMDVAWQATIKLFLCLDESGNWSHLEDDFLKPFKRVRIELQLGASSWVALIDGPIVDRNSDMDSQPGRSNITVIVHDDSALLNREDEVQAGRKEPDSDVARTLFRLARDGTILPNQIVRAPASNDSSVTPVQYRRGTAMEQLRRLARRHEFHAYVLPGAQRGRSIGCFRPDPTRSEGLPELVLLGADRNLSTLQVTEEAQTPTSFRASTLSIKDKKIVSRSSRSQELALIGPKATLPQSQTATQLLDPYANNGADPQLAVQTAAQQTSYSLRASGRVIPGCYAGVLRPYQLVTIRVGTTELSGSYLLTKATHRITPSLYTQEFSAKRNGVEQTGAQPDILGKIL